MAAEQDNSEEGDGLPREGSPQPAKPTGYTAAQQAGLYYARKRRIARQGQQK